MAPQTLEDTGLSDSQVLSLLLKALHRHGGLTGQELAQQVCLPFPVLDDILLSATQRHFVEVLGTSGHSRAGYMYDLTEEGQARAHAAMEASRYVGPAPVPLDQFREWVHKQSVKSHQVTKSELAGAFQDLVLSKDVTTALGPAVNSGASIFLHGAAGNGKTAIAERLGTLVSSEVFLPIRSSSTATPSWYLIQSIMNGWTTRTNNPVPYRSWC
jgi:predicted ATPase with chaperone activity